MGNSLLAVRDINHIYIVVERIFRLPEFDSEVKKVLDNKGLHITVPD